MIYKGWVITFRTSSTGKVDWFIRKNRIKHSSSTSSDSKEEAIMMAKLNIDTISERRIYGAV